MCSVTYYTLYVLLKIKYKNVFMQSIRETNHYNTEKCFVAMLEAWFRKGSPSWSDMVEALRGPGVEGGTLANNIQRKFIS